MGDTDTEETSGEARDGARLHDSVAFRYRS